MRIISQPQNQQSGNMLGGLLNPMSMLNMPMNMLGGLGIMGGLGNQPGMIEGLFNKDVPATGINALWDFLGMSGKLPQGWKATGMDALPLAGSIAGNMFLPYFGGMAGGAAGNLGAAMLLGRSGTSSPNYWNNRGM